MREKIIYALGAVAAILLVRNLYTMFMNLPDEAQQGAIYRILFFHAPAFFTFAAAVLTALVASVLYLVRGDFRYDSLAGSATEVGVAFGFANLITGMIWARVIWGIWWTWDARLTFMLLACVMYAGYLVLRDAIHEPTQRARISAVLSILTFPAVVITYKAIDWWRTQHPSAVLSFRTTERRMDPGMESLLYINFLALLLFAIVLCLVRLRQEELRRELDGLRREVHAF